MRDKINQWLDANVWDGDDRSGAKDDWAKFDPDELQELVEDCFNDLQGWVSVDELPKFDYNHFIVACEGGNVMESYFIGDRSAAMDYFAGNGKGSVYTRKRFGKNNAHFSVCHESGYKVEFYRPLIKHPLSGK